MDATELATKMIEYQTKKLELDALGEEIKAAVLETGKTQVVGKLRARYSNPRKSYDYQAAAENAGAAHALIDACTIYPEPPPPKVDWRNVCKLAGIEVTPTVTGEPSVTLVMEA